jgi:hypothetical protein
VLVVWCGGTIVVKNAKTHFYNPISLGIKFLYYPYKQKIKITKLQFTTNAHVPDTVYTAMRSYTPMNLNKGGAKIKMMGGTCA